MDVQSYLRDLAQANRSGAGFLLAYGFTWLTAAALGWRLGERIGTYAALFQGIVGLPLGLVLTRVIADGARPDESTLNALSVYLGTSQLLILPLVIVLIATDRHTMAVAALAVTMAVHFVPYAWLYSTPVYIFVGSVVAAGSAVLIARESSGDQTGPAICALTGMTLLFGGLGALAS